MTPDLIEYPLRSPSLHSVDSPRLITFDEQYIDLTPSRPLACPVEDASLPDELADEFLASYVNWPSDAQKSPIELANAGFIYTGKHTFSQ